MRPIGPVALVAVALAAISGALLAAAHHRRFAADHGCVRPYAPSSPWNAKIPAGAAGQPASALKGTLTSDPTQYTYPVYEVTGRQPRVPVSLRGYWSSVTRSGRSLKILSRPTVSIPLPPAAMAARGGDGQAIVVDRSHGDEWGFWRLKRTSAGWSAENGYHYNVRWSGVPPQTRGGRPFGSRGAGVPYLAGLVRPCEIAKGQIRHALAFAYATPSPQFVYPASKSDGKGRVGFDLPEGSRLRLSPSFDDARVRALGCAGPCLTIARALREYGMYLIDNSGRPKVMLEYEGTAHWNGLVTANTVSPLPLAAFEVVAPKNS